MSIAAGVMMCDDVTGIKHSVWLHWVTVSNRCSTSTKHYYCWCVRASSQNEMFNVVVHIVHVVCDMLCLRFNSNSVIPLSAMVCHKKASESSVFVPETILFGHWLGTPVTWNIVFIFIGCHHLMNEFTFFSFLFSLSGPSSPQRRFYSLSSIVATYILNWCWVTSSNRSKFLRRHTCHDMAFRINIGQKVTGLMRAKQKLQKFNVFFLLTTTTTMCRSLATERLKWKYFQRKRKRFWTTKTRAQRNWIEFFSSLLFCVTN